MNYISPSFAESDSLNLVTDLFRLHKFIIVVDGHGMVYALDSNSGEVLYNFPASSPLAQECSLDLLRTSAHGHPLMMLLCKSASNQAVLFNPLSGEVLSQSEIDGKIIAHSNALYIHPDGTNAFGVVLDDMRC